MQALDAHAGLADVLVTTDAIRVVPLASFQTI